MFPIVQRSGAHEYNVQCLTDLNSRFAILRIDEVRRRPRLFFSFKDYSGYAVLLVQCFRKGRLDGVSGRDSLTGFIK